MNWLRYSLLGLLLLLSSCISHPIANYANSADNLAANHDWHQLKINTDNFVLISYLPKRIDSNDMVTIYIEGDGTSWLTRSIVSNNPTPNNPIGLKLALRHPNNAVAYLSRPCQYVDQVDWGNCNAAYWTNKRFSPEVIEDSNQAIETIKQKFSAKHVILVGYSGGGAIAALVASGRQDVVQLVTVAGNLDHNAWTKLHFISPLNDSLNPADAWQTLQDIPQLHLVGSLDKNMPVEIAESYAERLPERNRPLIKVIPNADHSCCWESQWPALLTTLDLGN